MKIEVLTDKLSKTICNVDELKMDYNKECMVVDSYSKEDSIMDIFKIYQSGNKAILLDKTNKAIETILNKDVLREIAKVDFTFIMFTSGTTGVPVGAFKTKEDLELEALTFSKVLKGYRVDKVISTVPFIHLYGIMTGVFLPKLLDIDVMFKEHFLPYDLLNSITPYTVIATTPLYIKALLQLNETRKFKESIFISSTGPLSDKDAISFIEKYDTNLIQLYGSTETGAIAYKIQEQKWWTPLENVQVGVNSKNLLRIKSDYASKMLYEKGIKKSDGAMQSFDYVELSQDGKFKIIGRDSQIFKVGGKRFSTLQIEDILESLDSVKKAYITIKYDEKELKDEILHMFLESDKEITYKEIRKILNEHFGKITMPIKISIVEKIPTTALGKKIMPL